LIEVILGLEKPTFLEE